METKETEETMKNKTGAKFLSKCSMVFAGLWIAILTILKGLGKIELAESEIIGSGVAIVAVWTPTYFSILMDKVKDMKIGG